MLAFGNDNSILEYFHLTKMPKAASPLCLHRSPETESKASPRPQKNEFDEPKGESTRREKNVKKTC
jgi:hypothetical protein